MRLGIPSNPASSSEAESESPLASHANLKLKPQPVSASATELSEEASALRLQSDLLETGPGCDQVAIQGELKREYKNLTCEPEGGSNANGPQVYRLWNILGRRHGPKQAAQPSDVADHLLSTALGPNYQLAGATAYIFFPCLATCGHFHIRYESTPLLRQTGLAIMRG